VNKRWLPVGLLALGIFAVNAIARLVTRLGEIVKPTELDTIGFIASASVGVILIGAAAWWAVRHPFSRVFFDIGAAVLARDVAKQIEEELTYPGQIRVTVVRESRATEVAR